MDENNDPEALDGDQLQGSEDSNVITSQHVQHTEYAQQCWQYPVDNNVYGPEVISPYR